MTLGTYNVDMSIMFCCDEDAIYYPCAPGRVYSITFSDLVDADLGDEYIDGATTCGDVASMVADIDGRPRLLSPVDPSRPPPEWAESAGPTLAEEFGELLEAWADWCDRRQAALDSEDGVMDAIARVA